MNSTRKVMPPWALVAGLAGVAIVIGFVVWGTPTDGDDAAGADAPSTTSGIEGGLGPSGAAEPAIAPLPETRPGAREPSAPSDPRAPGDPSAPSPTPLPTELDLRAAAEAPPAAAGGAGEEAPEPDGPRGSLPAEAIRSRIRDALPELRFCFEWQLSRHPELAGRLTMEFTIDENGTVAEAHVAEDGLADDTVSRCFTHVMTMMRFPIPDPPGEVLVRYPFVLSGAPPAREPEGI